MEGACDVRVGDCVSVCGGKSHFNRENGVATPNEKGFVGICSLTKLLSEEVPPAAPALVTPGMTHIMSKGPKATITRKTQNIGGDGKAGGKVKL